jgi:hypothetical protein
MVGQSGMSALIVSLDQSLAYFAWPSLIVWFLQHVINDHTLPVHHIVDRLTLKSRTYATIQ